MKRPLHGQQKLRLNGQKPTFFEKALALYPADIRIYPAIIHKTLALVRRSTYMGRKGWGVHSPDTFPKAFVG
jgi:hypothetical protein